MNSGSATNVAIAMREAATGTLKGPGQHNAKYCAGQGSSHGHAGFGKSVTSGATPGKRQRSVVMTMQYN